ncbi:MAG: hypothetical protein AB7S97_03865 [Thermoplasmata archaeon]
MGRVLWYVARRLMILFLGIMLILTAQFVIFRVLPEDPARLALPHDPSHYYGDYGEEVLALFEKPLLTQYIEFIGDMLGGDFRFSYIAASDVEDVIYDAALRTLALFLGLLSICLPLGMLGGYIVFRMKTHVSRQALSIVLLALFSTPVVVSFWILLRYIFYEWGLLQLPIGDSLAALVAVAVAASLTLVGAIALIVRDGLVVSYAVSRPDQPRLRDALFIGMPKIQFIIAGSMTYVLAAEVMFVRPGLGYYFLSSFWNLDYFLLQATFFLMVVMVFLTNYAIETAVTLARPMRRLDMYLREDSPVAGTAVQEQSSCAASNASQVKGALSGIARDYPKSPIGVVSLIVFVGFIVLAAIGPMFTSEEQVYWFEPSYTDMFLNGATALIVVPLIVGALASMVGIALGLVAGLTRPYADGVVSAAMQALIAFPAVCLVFIPYVTHGYVHSCVDIAIPLSLPVSALVTLLVCHGVVSSRRVTSASVGRLARYAPAFLSWTLSGLKYGMPMAVVAGFFLDAMNMTHLDSWGYAFDVAAGDGFSTFWNWFVPALAMSILVGSMFLVFDTLERVVRTRLAAHL